MIHLGWLRARSRSCRPQCLRADCATPLDTDERSRNASFPPRTEREGRWVHAAYSSLCTDEPGLVTMALIPNQEHFREDLPRLAAENFAIANRTCLSCGHMHALWPYIRLARASTGIEGESSDLDRVLRELIAKGQRRVLIAGSQDTGLMALVARAAGTSAVEITVLDRCASPLEFLPPSRTGLVAADRNDEAGSDGP